jgi:hypothetical protein
MLTVEDGVWTIASMAFERLRMTCKLDPKQALICLTRVNLGLNLVKSGGRATTLYRMQGANLRSDISLRGRYSNDTSTFSLVSTILLLA